MSRGLAELAAELRAMINPGALPDESDPLTVEALLAAVERASERADYHEWEDRMGDDL